MIIKDLQEAKLLADFMLGRKPPEAFTEAFKGRYSEGFNVELDLGRIGVVNQTTLLASDTQEIADYLMQAVREKYGVPEQDIADHFANMKDTLCYATNDNQNAVINMLTIDADLAIVVGGYNSSNTSHLVELCAEKLPTYFISSCDNIISRDEIIHWDIHDRQQKTTSSYLPDKEVVVIHLTSGASCPDILIENVIAKLLSFYNLLLN